MLSLSRKPGEEIIIGQDIIVKIHYIDKDTVGLLIQAPKDVAVDRMEIRQAKEKDARAAKKGTPCA